MPAKYLYVLIDKETKDIMVSKVTGLVMLCNSRPAAQQYQQSWGGKDHVAIKPVKIEDFLKLLKK